MSKAQLQYAERYAEAAMDQMKRYGIPASVILAQGIIESASGASELSRKGNNHFGIKATSAWLEEGGRYLVYDDDKADEKFCAYDSVADSYEHHSRFLVENRRYASLFNLSPDDYEGWAEGLQKAHYASSASYADTIKAVIRNNGLDRYDRMAMAEMQDLGKVMSADSGRDVTQEDTRGSYSFPLAARDFLLVTSPFGMRKDPMDPGRQQMHKGIDIRADHARLFATEDDGRIVSVNNNANTGGGRSVTVEYDRENGARTQVTYMHLDSISVKVGDVVHAGQELGISGNTGTRTTGPHLHLGVRQFTAEGVGRDVDPASYLADIAVKGDIGQQVLYNGENLLDKYMTPQEKQIQLGQEPGRDLPMGPEEWMRRILCSEDSGSEMGQDTLWNTIVNIFSALLALALHIDGRDETEKMQAATDAALSREINLTGLVQGVSECVLKWPKSGSPQLEMTSGGRNVTHVLTEDEIGKLASILEDSSRSDSEKQQRLAVLVNQIVLQKQVSLNYEQTVGQGVSQGLQR